MQSAQPTPVDVFLRTHPDRGGLRVQVTCGGGRFPVAGAQVVISRAFGTEYSIPCSSRWLAGRRRYSTGWRPSCR